MQGLASLVYALGFWALVLAGPPISRRVLALIWPWAILLGYSLISLLWYSPTGASLQNLVAISAFIATLYLASIWGRSQSYARRVVNFALLATGIMAVGYAYSLARSGLAAESFMPARVFALCAIYGVALLAALARHSRRAYIIPLVLLTLLVALSLSRTALFACILVLALAFMPSHGFKGWLRLAVAATVAMGGLLLAVNNIQPLHDRFFSGDTSLSAGGVSINASGRTGIWRVVLDTWQTSPWIGRGAGSANADIDAELPVAGISGHPHNDYLLVLHDYGVLGEAFFILGWLFLVYGLHRAWREAIRGGRAFDAMLALTAFLTVAGLLVAMSTDNPLTYPFVMVPSFFIIGSALGRWAAASRVSSARRADPRANISTPIRVRA